MQNEEIQPKKLSLRELYREILREERRRSYEDDDDEEDEEFLD